MRVVAGQIVRLQLHAADMGRAEICSLSVAVSQPVRSHAYWRLTIEPRFDLQAVTRTLGAVETIPPGRGGPPQSVVAIATAPGAVSWFVEVERLRVVRDEQSPPTAYDQVIDVDLSAFPDVAVPGVSPILGASRLVGERYLYQAAAVPAGASSVAVPAGRLVQAISVYQVGTGGTVSVDGGAALPLPPDGAVQWAPRGTLVGPTTVDCAAFPAGGGGYLIEETQ